MARTPGSAQYTESISSTVTPEQKQNLIAEAARRGVPYAIVVRWAIDAWLKGNTSSPESAVPSARKAS